MRLSPEQIRTIKQVVRKHCGGEARVWLFGSRVDDAARGGDIDLFVNATTLIPDRAKCESQIVLDIWKAIGEQKIDVIVVDAESRPQPIHAVARETGVLL